ncbi:gliK [Symbiodinium natans]|uniref:gamma-glutamylcyclotransferase n=1 Tax=Symbiodinium natans TaxID=878477 RepID=A0A812J8T2_9DINO|nr:gliK [Symbiodinium natans]
MSLPPSRALVGGVAGQRVSRAWNFAYGSNLDELTRRRRQLRPSQIQPAVAHGWELRFSLPGIPFLEPAFASLRPSRSNSISTHGVCLELGMEGWFRLLTSEGVLGAAEVNELRMRQASLEEVLDRAAKKDQDVRGYRLLPIEVLTYSTSQRETAYALVDGNFEPPAPQIKLPSLRYWRLLRNGARRHGLTREYRDYLASLPRYVPSLLAPAALPAIAGDAMKWWTPGASLEQEAWPQLKGPASLAQGRLEIGPDPSNAVWNKFCSMPRDDVLKRVLTLVGEECPTLYWA